VGERARPDRVSSGAEEHQRGRREAEDDADPDQRELEALV
jgi:hypothetical protein